jgi:hypothetical protein
MELDPMPKSEKAPQSPITVFVDPDTGDAWKYKVDMTHPAATGEMLRAVLIAASPSGRMTNWRAIAGAMPKDYPERAEMLTVLNQIDTLLVDGVIPDEKREIVRGLFDRVQFLAEHAKRRTDKRTARTARARGGAKTAAGAREATAERNHRIRTEFDRLSANDRTTAVGKLASLTWDGESLSESQIRRIVQPAKKTRTR